VLPLLHKRPWNHFYLFCSIVGWQLKSPLGRTQSHECTTTNRIASFNSFVQDGKSMQDLPRNLRCCYDSSVLFSHQIFPKLLRGRRSRGTVKLFYNGYFGHDWFSLVFRLLLLTILICLETGPRLAPDVLIWQAIPINRRSFCYQRLIHLLSEL